MRNRNVLISGAGPAGMTLAYWLRRHGFSPTVVERASAPRDGGQAAIWACTWRSSLSPTISA